MGEFVKIVVFVPVAYAEKIRDALAESGAGRRGNYDYCSFSARGQGRFRPLKGSRPFIGVEGRIEVVEEERVETIVPKSKLKSALKRLRKAHPYEEPAIDVYPLLEG